MIHRYCPNIVDIPLISIDDNLRIIPNVDLRYRLSIPIKNRRTGINISVILMNPAEADVTISDKTVNKLIDFFYNFSNSNIQIKNIDICNVIPIYAISSLDTANKLKNLHTANFLKSIEIKNINKINDVLKKSDKVVLAWGQPNVNTIHRTYYYSQINKILETLLEMEKDIYVFDMLDSKAKFNEYGDPRHAGRSAVLNKLLNVSVEELFGLV
ncbi:DUF1643 domain-containing protein [Cytobacillus oceanisediminis]|uniref:DUF1643 domain-containing protein n=1 Tax=Cytobacillus oceanisediminis TaxID=665099 RepID=UPI0023DCD746|nr:DUF1643 domain-containing protein [Cytobacillus oceanisediminis]MDF2036326.1 DUF1643 domain-containing protein [Cytobacillus oceanisediminis]